MAERNLLSEKETLLVSLLRFTQYFFAIRTGRKFELSEPDGRESHYITICKALMRVMKGETRRLVINVPPRYGKAIACDTIMFTSGGWKEAAEVKKGDYLLGSKGWTKVQGVFPQGVLKAKKVTFSDNQSIICNDEHLWAVSDRYTETYKIKTTAEIQSSLFEADKRKHWHIPMLLGDQEGRSQNRIDPYLLGCWLGDGHSHYAAITTMDKEIVQAFEEKGHLLRPHSHQSAGKAITYGIIHNGFQSTLRKLGLLANKHFPTWCFDLNKKDRIALLQGLMDTDGTCGKNGQVSFTNTNESILDGCAFLVVSLGGTYRIYTRKCGTKTLNIRLPDYLHPFRLERKQKNVSFGNKCKPRRHIKSIEDAGQCEMVCFKVDAEDSLFAAGKGLVLTHNTELLIHFVAWAMAQFPDSNFLYVSYSLGLAKKQTKTVRQIMASNEFRDIFGIKLSDETSAQGNFETQVGGSVYAAGADGEITGRGAGIKGVDRFGGCIVIDDIHKPSEVSSDTIRTSVNEWYFNTLQSRLNDPENTPIIFIGQRLHEDDLAANLIQSGDWETVIIPAMDVAGNPLHPKMHSKDALIKMQETMPYVYSSQYQQDPLPAGGGIFKPEWFWETEEEPNILSTFICADTAETDKSYNDATVFTFFGLYKIMHGDDETGQIGLHILDCLEIRIEPKDLEREFMAFYSACMRHRVKPRIAAIEKKSTGVTLSSILKNIRGLQIIDIERTHATGNKTTRFLEIQPILAARQVSLPKDGRHTHLVKEHMRKITANDSHRFDDIADTIYDGVKLGIIDNIIMSITKETAQESEKVARNIMGSFKRVLQLRMQRT